MRDCPDCDGHGRIGYIPETNHPLYGPEHNPENEIDYPCRRCNETGEIGGGATMEEMTQHLQVLAEALTTPAPELEERDEAA